MFLKLITFSSLLLGSLASIKDCDTTSIFRPTLLALTPDPPIPGQPIKLTLVFDNTGSEIADLEGGTVTTTITINGIRFAPSVEPLCENVGCPIIFGSNDRSTEITFPDVSGVIKSRTVWTSGAGAAGKSLLCIESAFKVTSSSWNPFAIIRNSYINNKNKINNLYNKFKDLAYENNIRGIINEVNEINRDSIKTTLENIYGG